MRRVNESGEIDICGRTFHRNHAFYIRMKGFLYPINLESKIMMIYREKIIEDAGGDEKYQFVEHILDEDQYYNDFFLNIGQKPPPQLIQEKALRIYKRSFPFPF